MRLATIVISLLIATSVSAQRNVAYFELGGNGIIPSFNYERQLSERLYGRVGFSFVVGEEADGDTDQTYIFPLMVNYLTHPAGNHHFEAGAGATWITGDSQDLYDNDDDEELSNLVGTLTIGYRYQKPARGFVFRAGFTPVFDTGGVLPWGGVSFGYRW